MQTQYQIFFLQIFRLSFFSYVKRKPDSETPTNDSQESPNLKLESQHESQDHNNV